MTGIEYEPLTRSCLMMSATKRAAWLRRLRRASSSRLGKLPPIALTGFNALCWLALNGFSQFGTKGHDCQYRLITPLSAQFAGATKMSSRSAAALGRANGMRMTKPISRSSRRCARLATCAALRLEEEVRGAAAHEMRRLRELEQESGRLKKMVADLALDRLPA